MSVEFDEPGCQTLSDRKKFGLCDDPTPAHNPAYIDEKDGSKWIAVVENEYGYSVTFTAIDNCIEIMRPDRTMEKRCDGMLTYNSAVIFVELKQRGARGNAWVVDAESQLRATIREFEKTERFKNFDSKKAYISNSEHPRFRASQAGRMERFFDDTGYIIRIEARIKLE
jgi:hypothetical protein